MSYPRLQPRRLSLGLEVADLMAYALSLASLVEVNRVERIIADDPDDDIFIACAAAATARYLISGDRHMLSLQRYEQIDIVQPHVFLAREFPPMAAPDTLANP